MPIELVKNKKAFTLIELLFSISIFSIIILITFSVVNYAPELFRKESAQFSERTYVRSAVADITGTIQNASSVANPPLQFTMPDGRNITYEFNNGNVDKVIDDKAYRLMESVEEFSIETAENHLFYIHIKTLEEGMVYDSKVERRKGGFIRTNLVIASITPDTAVFDKRTELQNDINITLNLNGTTLNGLRNGLSLLVPVQNYTINGNILTLKKEYLATLPNGTASIVFNVSVGVDPVLKVEVVDTSTFLKIEGNSYEDDIIRMNYPGNLQIDPEDSKWIITVTKGTVADGFDIDDLLITGLPPGINVSAEKITGNRILITLSGSAVEPVAQIKPVEIVVRGSAVKETQVSDSEPIEVFLLPGASFASPEHNLVFTNELVFRNNVTITGDIVIGRGSTMTTIDNNTGIYGYVYVDSSLTTNNNVIFGSPDKKTKVFVKGSAIFNNNAYIYGDLFYRDTLTTRNMFYISGTKAQSAVEIPPISIPELKSEQWYRDNGYTIVNSSWPKVNLVDNGKYYFKIPYSFDSISDLDNVTIVGKSNLTFDNNFSGSGIIFAPDGTITFNNTTKLTGMCISKSTILNNNSTLIYKRYLELPFD